MSMLVSIHVNGKHVECDGNTTIIQAAAQVGIEIPTLCYLKEYAPQSTCSLCLVEVEGNDGLLLACSTKVSAGMSVQTESERVFAARKTCLELLFSDHAGACVGKCTNACPADLAISEFLDQVEAGNDSEALKIIRESLALPAVLGHVCQGYCESACIRKQVDKPISIRRMHGALAEADLVRSEPELPPIDPASGKRVAIVGAGPTGLSAAFYLLQRGHESVLHDANERAGGLLRYGMNESLLPKAVLDQEIRFIEKMGAQFKQKWRLGLDAELEDLRRDYDAVLLATGAIGPPEKRKAVREFLAVLGLGDTAVLDKRTGATSTDGVFAAGEAVFGASKVVRAVAAGRAVAATIHQWFQEGVASPRQKPFLFRSVMTPEERDAFFDQPGAGPRRASRATIRPPFLQPVDDAQPLSEPGEGSKKEASRCLDCTCASFDNCKLRIYAARYGVNEKRFSGVRRTLATDRTHPEVDFEPGKCILCGLCIVVAQEAGELIDLGFSGRGFDVRLTLPFGESFVSGLGKSARRCAQVCPVGAITLKQKTR